MAAKTTKSKKSTKSTPKKNTTKTTKREQQQSAEIKSEIIILATLAVCILLCLSNFGMGGIAGETVSSVFFGLFGSMAYLLPFVLFGVTAFLISNKGNAHAYIKIAAGVVLFLILTAILELIFNQYQAGTQILAYYTASSEHRNAGGLTGGCIVSLLCPLIGEIGTYVVLFIFAIICIILITERSLLSPLGRQSRKAYEEAKRKHQETAVIRARQAEERREAEARRREEESMSSENSRTKSSGRRSERKVSGVSFATTLEPENGSGEKKRRGRRKNPDLQELTLDGPMESPFPEEQPDLFVINRAEPSDGSQTEEMPDLSAARSDIPAAEMSQTEPGLQETEETDAPSGQTGKTKRRKNRQDAAAVAAETENVAEAVRESEEKELPVYHTPPLSLLKRGKKGGGDSDAHLRATAKKLEQTLQNFGVGVHVTNASCGPSVTRYELQPEQGVKVSRIVGLADDIKLNLAVADLRIEAPIPGKAAVGIEVPNSENTAVMLRDLLESREFQSSSSPITFAVGKDIAGKVVVADIAKMPHLLVAGATGSGKSVCINTLIMSIIYKADPENVKLILVDPKVVELSVYNGIPHLMIPVVTDPKKAAGALNWAVAEMEKRYKLFAEYNVRDLKGFNEKVEKGETAADVQKKLPQIIIIIDELADLMMVAPGEVEGAICRLAQLARAAGLHLILATQRPSVNVITGLIKANMPSRIAFSVSSGVDSRTIIDMNGAEKLLGKGDMLFYPSGYPKPVRVQGSFVSDKEVQSVVDYLISSNGNTSYNNELEEHMNTNLPGQQEAMPGESREEHDAYFIEAGKLIIDKEKASIGMLQRMFKIGFNRAARIIDQLADAGIVGPEEGTKPRKILMSPEQLDAYFEENL